MYEDFIPIVIRNVEDAVNLAKSIQDPILPIFLISNNKGTNIKLLKQFLNVLPISSGSKDNSSGSEYIILNKCVPNDKIILMGSVYQGIITRNKKMYLGPLLDQNFV